MTTDVTNPDPHDEDLGYLSYLGNDTPRYVVVMWVVSLAVLGWYTWVWYLPELSAWMS